MKSAHGKLLNEDVIYNLWWEKEDRARFDLQGGYPSQIEIDETSGKIYIATVNHKDAPELHSFTHDEYLKHMIESLEAESEEDFDFNVDDRAAWIDYFNKEYIELNDRY